MRDELVPVYHALTVDDAQRLADILQRRGVESYVENTVSPLYNMTQGPAAHVVLVDRHAAATARDTVRQYEADWHYGVPRDEQDYEQTGFELPDDPRPSQDDPADNFISERTHMDRPGPESPEVENLITEDRHHEEVDWREHRIVGIGPDRGLTEPPDSDAPEVEDQNLDNLHIDTGAEEPPPRD